MTYTCSTCPTALCLIRPWCDFQANLGTPHLIATFHLPFVPESYNNIHTLDSNSGKMRPILTAKAKHERTSIHNELETQLATYREAHQNTSESLRMNFPLSSESILQFTYFRPLWSQKGTLLTWDTGNPWPMYSSKWAMDCMCDQYETNTKTRKKVKVWTGLFTDDKWVFAAPPIKVDWKEGNPFTLICVCRV